MALRIHSLEQTAARVAHAPVSSQIKPSPTAPSATGSQQTATSQAASSQASSFTAVFAQIAAAAAAAGTTAAGTAAPAAPSAPAASNSAAADASAGDPAGPLFGPNPWLSDPTGQGPDGIVTHYNPIYFATQQTAETVAQIIGGKVVESDQIITSPNSPFTQDEPNYMVQMPDGALVNPGLVADIYAHGWNQDTINQDVENEVAGAEAAVNG